MKTAIYPGSFNPWHKGHTDILVKALQVFDKVVVAPAKNPDKENYGFDLRDLFKNSAGLNHDRIRVKPFEGLLVDFVEHLQISYEDDICAIIRGLRNGHDLQYETNQQYWNEDLGLTIPVVYFITDRSHGHISSSAIRALRKVEEE